MAKIPNDKYYTPQHIVDTCVNKVKEIVADNVTEIIDPSQGYTNENSVPCCTFCNFAKHTMGKDDFLAWVKRVYAFNFN